ncbi:MAG TPA: hypothetical protein VIM62_02955 [Acidobacteriaceae bacterium]
MTGTAIMLGQSAVHPFSKSKTVVHTALYIGGGEVAEASAGGIHVNSLNTNLQNYKYKVYRYRGEGSDRLIKTVIEHVHTNRSQPNDYSMKRAIFSNFLFGSKKPKESEKVPLLGHSDVFCSGTVVDWFNESALELDMPAPIAMDGSSASPQALDGWLKGSSKWEFIQKLP